MLLALQLLLLYLACMHVLDHRHMHQRRAASVTLISQHTLWERRECNMLYTQMHEHCNSKDTQMMSHTV